MVESFFKLLQNMVESFLSRFKQKTFFPQQRCILVCSKVMLSVCSNVLLSVDNVEKLKIACCKKPTSRTMWKADEVGIQSGIGDRESEWVGIELGIGDRESEWVGIELGIGDRGSKWLWNRSGIRNRGPKLHLESVFLFWLGFETGFRTRVRF